MKKFLVLYKASRSSFDQMKSATPEQQKAGMDAWMAWGKKASSAIVDMGAPLGSSLRVTTAGKFPCKLIYVHVTSASERSLDLAMAEVTEENCHSRSPD